MENWGWSFITTGYQYCFITGLAMAQYGPLSKILAYYMLILVMGTLTKLGF
jgi:hypothetical protein